ncbi:hypothetical protein BDV26DRAFT_154370 [Aspergillus bertholletiae]|uniref:Uncharacterized protein n=1 Tax=Aspergillus bertholletiae TaxID=1226010 RepID=A0A5N7AP09_9EURO|nr:hypothetical protein BDV26DRAFT_154370 [Aspergillus bertholletiae]
MTESERNVFAATQGVAAAKSRDERGCGESMSRKRTSRKMPRCGGGSHSPIGGTVERTREYGTRWKIKGVSNRNIWPTGVPRESEPAKGGEKDAWP